MVTVGLVASSGMFAGFAVSPLPASGHLPPQAGEGMVSVSAASAVALSGVGAGFAALSGIVTGFSAWAIFSAKVAPPTVSMDGVPSGALSAPSPAGGGGLGWGCFRLVAAMSCGCGIGSAAWIKVVAVSSGMFTGFAVSPLPASGHLPPQAGEGMVSVSAAGAVALSGVFIRFPPSSGIFAGFPVPMLFGVASAGFVWWAEAHPTVSVDGVPSDVFTGVVASSETVAGFCCFSSAIR